MIPVFAWMVFSLPAHAERPCKELLRVAAEEYRAGYFSHGDIVMERALTGSITPPEVAQAIGLILKSIYSSPEEGRNFEALLWAERLALSGGLWGPLSEIRLLLDERVAWGKAELPEPATAEGVDILYQRPFDSLLNAMEARDVPRMEAEIRALNQLGYALPIPRDLDESNGIRALLAELPHVKVLLELLSQPVPQAASAAALDALNQDLIQLATVEIPVLEGNAINIPRPYVAAEFIHLLFDKTPRRKLDTELPFFETLYGAWAILSQNLPRADMRWEQFVAMSDRMDRLCGDADHWDAVPTKAAEHFLSIVDEAPPARSKRNSNKRLEIYFNVLVPVFARIPHPAVSEVLRARAETLLKQVRTLEQDARRPFEEDAILLSTYLTQKPSERSSRKRP